jgi:diguanylate cyclase (GGDEF)-like protein
VVLLPETSGELASRVAERLREAAAATVLGQAGTVTLSIGVAEMHPEQQADSLIQQADVAMYQAKRSGRNRVVLWRSRSREPAAAEADAPEPSTGID